MDIDAHKDITDEYSHDDAEYKKHIDSDEWRKFRKIVFLHYGRVCIACKATKEIDVHHRTYIAWKLGRAETLAEVIPLCRECHDELHSIHRSKTLNPDKAKTIAAVTKEYLLNKNAIITREGYKKTVLPPVLRPKNYGVRTSKVTNGKSSRLTGEQQAELNKKGMKFNSAGKLVNSNWVHYKSELTPEELIKIKKHNQKLRNWQPKPNLKQNKKPIK